MATSENKVYLQIEQSADFYQPAVYELLSFYHSLENQQEPLDGQFIPLTTVQSYGPDRALLFAVGLIPPSSNVSGRLLDRSASVQALGQGDDTKFDLDPETPQTDDTRPADFVVRPGSGLVQNGCLTRPFHEVREVQGGGTKLHQGIDIGAKQGSEIRVPLDGTVVDISPNGTRLGYGHVIMVEHANGNITLYAHMDDFGPGMAVGTKVTAGTVIGYVGNTDTPVVNSKFAPATHLHFEVLSKRVEGFPRSSGIVANKGTSPSYVGVPQRLDPVKWLQQNGAAIANAKADKEIVPSCAVDQDGETASKWATKGSDNAQQASKTASQVANKDLNQTNLGKKFMAQQQVMINQMINALEQMADTPPLRLLVNPQSFRVSAEKIISDGNWGRSGPIIEFWGDSQDKIEGSGKVAGFYSMSVLDATGPGLTRTARQFSTSYQNLLALWLIYKNNGGVWFPDPLVPAGSKAKNLSVVGSVYLYYDNFLYVGSFDSFSLTESETAPFSLEYSFSFTVRATFLLDHLGDAQYTYGQAKVPSLATTSSNTPALSGANNAQLSPNVQLPTAPDGLGPVGPSDFAEGGVFEGGT